MAKRRSSGGSGLAKKARSGWLLSYGDMITLLITFFIMMIAIQRGEILAVHAWVNTRLDESAEQLSSVINPDVVEQNQDILIERESKGIKVILRDPKSFNAGSAEPNLAFTNKLELIASTISKLDIINIETMPEHTVWIKQFQEGGYKWEFEIRIEGHTDSTGLSSKNKYNNNWELSAARAQAVMRILQEFSKLDEKIFAVAGFGEFQPTASNDTAANRALNRRVEELPA